MMMKVWGSFESFFVFLSYLIIQRYRNNYKEYTRVKRRGKKKKKIPKKFCIIFVQQHKNNPQLLHDNIGPSKFYLE